MASSSGGMVFNNNHRHLGSDYPELKRHRNLNLEEFTTVDGQRQKHECKFLLISHQDETQNLDKVSPFVIQKGLDNITTNLKNVKKIRSGQLMVETKYSSQIEKLLNATVLFGSIPITVKLHPHLNSTKGIVYAPDLIDVTEQTICEELKDQKVIEIKRIRRLPNSKDSKTVVTDSEGFVPTPLLIVTFSVTALPKKLKAAYLMLNVEPYVPNPMRCKHCQLFGHTKNRCKSITGNCANCSLNYDEFHPEGVLCNNPSLCANCRGPHEAFRKCCRRFKEEYAISRIKTVERITYHEAKQKYAILNPVNHMVPIAEMVKITSSQTTPALTRTSPISSIGRNSSPVQQSSSTSKSSTSPQRKEQSPKPKTAAKKPQQQEQTTQRRSRSNHRTPTPAPERLSDERRAELHSVLQDKIQEKNQNQQNQQNQQKPSKPNPFAFSMPSQLTALASLCDMISDGESSTSSLSSIKSNSINKRKTNKQNKNNTKNKSNMDIS